MLFKSFYYCDADFWKNNPDSSNCFFDEFCHSRNIRDCYSCDFGVFGFCCSHHIYDFMSSDFNKAWFRKAWILKS